MLLRLDYIFRGLLTLLTPLLVWAFQRRRPLVNWLLDRLFQLRIRLLSLPDLIELGATLDGPQIRGTLFRTDSTTNEIGGSCAIGYAIIGGFGSKRLTELRVQLKREWAYNGYNPYPRNLQNRLGDRFGPPTIRRVINANDDGACSIPTIVSGLRHDGGRSLPQVSRSLPDYSCYEVEEL